MSEHNIKKPRRINKRTRRIERDLTPVQKLVREAKRCYPPYRAGLLMAAGIIADSDTKRGILHRLSHSRKEHDVRCFPIPFPRADKGMDREIRNRLEKDKPFWTEHW